MAGRVCPLGWLEFTVTGNRSNGLFVAGVRQVRIRGTQSLLHMALHLGVSPAGAKEPCGDWLNPADERVRGMWTPPVNALRKWEHAA